MAYIELPEGLPGISGLMVFRPETAGPLNELAQALLRGDSLLSAADRELIATYVSSLNGCHYCQSIHGAIAAHHLGGAEDVVLQVKRDYASSPISPMLKALLAIAEKVQSGGNHVTSQDILHARDNGATDLEIHDAILIAAAFCMFNRYVDGLSTWQPNNPAFYAARGATVAEHGYLNLTRDPVSISK